MPQNLRQNNISHIIRGKTSKVDLRKIFNNSSLPRLETELLLSYLLKKPREFLITHPETKIRPTIYKRFKLLEAKRQNNWPIAYLTGYKEFYGFDFKVSPAVLIPRPETELLVDKIINFLTNNRTVLKPIIVDLGTGSGGIIITVAKELKRLMPSVYNQSEFIAVDISAVALKIAKINADKHKLTRKIKFYRGDLLIPLKFPQRNLNQSELIITANLPYLTPTQIIRSPSISREPRLALDGGRRGLKYYQALLSQLADLPADLKFRVYCEIDDSQATTISALSKKYLPRALTSITRDLSGKQRLFIIQKSELR